MMKRKRLLYLILLFVVFGSNQAFSIDIYVDGTIPANGNGNISSPYKTIQAAATVANPGDRVIIRQGTYRETVTPAKSGTASARITYLPYNNDVVTIEATDKVTGWEVYKNQIYRTKFTLGLGAENQLFINEKMGHLARWPNVSEESVDDPFFVHTNYSWADKTGSARGIISDSRLPLMPTDFYKGATLWANFGVKWTSFGTAITASTGSKLYYTTTNDNDHYPFSAPWSPFVSTNKEYYFLSGKFDFLDTNNEWFYRNDSIYLMVKSGIDPNVSVKAKKRLTCLNMNGKSYITVKGIHFFGGAITMNTSNYCVIDNINAKFLTHHSMLNVKPYELRFSQLINRNGINISGESNSIINSTIKYSAGTGITIAGGSNHLIENNDIQYCNYVNQYCEGINSCATSGENIKILRNKIWYAGGPLIVAERGDTWTNNRGHFIAYNDLAYGEQLGDDRGGLNGSGYEVCYNWVHHIGRGLASSIVPGLYTDVSRDYATYHHNVVWAMHTTNTTAHILINNTGIGAAQNGNQGIFVYNNTGYGKGWETTMTAGLWQTIITDKNNLCNPPSSTFENATTGDFRLKSTATNAIDKAVAVPPFTNGYVGANPDLGAYEYGKTDGSSNWKAGIGVEMFYPAYVAPTAIDEIKSEKKTIFAYHNRTTNKLIIKGLYENINISVYDMKGVLLLRNNSANNEIDTGSFEKGVYILRVSDSKNVLETLKFLKN